LSASLDDLGRKNNNPRASVLGKALDVAIGRLLENDKSPSRKTGELDNRGSHFYLAMYWAQELAQRSDDERLAAHFQPLAESLAASEQQILDELNTVQGQQGDVDA